MSDKLIYVYILLLFFINWTRQEVQRKRLDALEKRLKVLEMLWDTEMQKRKMPKGDRK